MKQRFIILSLFLPLGIFAQKRVESQLIPDSVFIQKDLNKKTLDIKQRGVKQNSAILFTQSSYRKSNPSVLTKSLTPNKPNTLKLLKDFFVFLEKGGDFYLLANTLSTYITKDKFQEIKVYINGEYQGVLNSTKGDWEVIGIKGKKTVPMTIGKNIITFESEIPFYPEIDCIQLASSEQDLIKKNYIYEEYIKNINNVNSRSAFIGYNGQSSWTVTPENIGAKKGYYYTGWAKVPVVYTYHRKLYLKNEENIFYTTPIEEDNESYWLSDPIMHLYKIDDPNKYSWTNDNGNKGYHPEIKVKPPAGDYYLVVRSKVNGWATNPTPREALVNVYWNGIIANKSVPISGYMIDAPVKYKETLNYFTGKSSGTPKIFLFNNDKILYNTEPYTYYPPADFDWMDNARIKISHRVTNNNWKMLITSEGSWYVYYGNCDVYGGLRDAPQKYLTKFPKLKKGDAILTADDNSSYNAAAWAGGITNQNITIGKLSPWSSWDAYFGNTPQRYAGAQTLSRSNYGQVAVALYSKDNNVANATHFATTNSANLDLHGFDFESKIGTWGRITHERNSLNGNEYGSPYVYYYRPYSSDMSLSRSAVSGETYTFEQSLSDGLTVIEDIELNPYQLDIVNNYQLNKSLQRSINKLDILFNNWKQSIQSDKYVLTNDINDYCTNQEAKVLIEYGKQNLNESILFFGNKIFNDSSKDLSRIISPFIFAEIAEDKYGNILQKIKEKWANNPYTDKGAYIFPSSDNFSKKYLKEIINQNMISNVFQETKNVQSECELQNTDGLFSILENPVTETGTYAVVKLPCDAKISLFTVPVFAGKQHDIVINKMYIAGEYKFKIEHSSLGRGVNICTININGQNFSRKILKK